MNWTNNSLILIDGLTGIIFIILSYVSIMYPPKTINPIYGYRTNRSMMTEEHWSFAQNYSAKQMIKSGTALIFIGLLSLFIPIEHTLSMYIAIAAIVISALLVFYNTETQLKKRFK